MRRIGYARFRGTSRHATNPIDGRPEARRKPHKEEILEALGTVSFRTAMGNGAGGLQPWRNGVGVSSARSCEVARVPLGRGWDRGNQRPAPIYLLCAGVVEWAGPNFEGTVVWADGERGEPRGGRQGVLLLPGFDADAQLSENAVQVSAAGVSLCAAGGGEPQARAIRAGIRAAGHGSIRGGPVFRRVRGVCQGGRRRHLDPDYGGEPRAGGGAAASAADAVVPEHVVVGQRFAEAARPGVHEPARDSLRRTSTLAVWQALAAERWEAAVALHGKRDQQCAAVQRAQPQPVREGCFPRILNPREGGRSQPRASGNENGGLVSAGAGGGAIRDGQAAADGHRAAGGMSPDLPIIGTITAPAHKERGEGVPWTNDFGEGFDALIAARKKDADEFYATRIPKDLSADARSVMRQAYAGLLWTKQFYYYDVRTWLEGDPAGPKPPSQRLHGRNKDWTHLYNEDIISMPDKWEYPWYAAWDLAFNCIPMAIVDPDFAKEQLILLLREWYMHPNGQLPAYEWAFGDVNPPVHAWAAWRVYKIERRIRGVADRAFLEKVFHKLLLNFTWWVNRKDPDGANIFQGGFLGLDNIGVFDRSAPLPTGGHLEQSDGTSWMGMYCLNMLAIALELAKDDPAYEDVASKFFEHFVYIARAIHDIGRKGRSLWDEVDGFYYDVLHLPNGDEHFIKIRSMVGLIPLFAVETLEPEIVDCLPGFKRRMQWFIENHSDVPEHIEMTQRSSRGVRRLLSLVSRKQLRRVLSRMLDETEFLSPYGIRALSRYHKDHPYEVRVNGQINRVDYEPAESTTGIFGGNSNWRGPVWSPVNYLIVESLQKFHHYYGEDFRIECPTRSRNEMDLWAVAADLSRRLIHLFLRGPDGRRPVAGGIEVFQSDPHWKDLILFHEYFHGDNGAGIGANHQTGWTGLVAKLIQQSGE